MKAIHNPLKMFPSQGLPYAHDDEDEAEESAGAGGDHGGAAEVLDRSPNDGAKDAASVEGKSWDQVEQSEHGVDEREVLGDRPALERFALAAAPKGKKAPPARG